MKKSKPQKLKMAIPHWQVAGLFVLVCAIAVFLMLQPKYKVLRDLDGKYNTQIISEKVRTEKGTWIEINETRYIYNGKEIRSYLPPGITDSFDWIKNSTEPDAFILSWWDYGHPIRAYTGREVFIDAPSKEIEYCVEGRWKWDYCPHADIYDAADFYTTNNTKHALEILHKHNINYVFFYRSDVAKSIIFYQIMGLDPGDYVSMSVDGRVRNTNLGRDSMVFMIYYKDNIEGMRKVYEDTQVIIYKVVN